MTGGGSPPQDCAQALSALDRARVRFGRCMSCQLEPRASALGRMSLRLHISAHSRLTTTISSPAATATDVVYSNGRVFSRSHGMIRDIATVSTTSRLVEVLSHT